MNNYLSTFLFLFISSVSLGQTTLYFTEHQEQIEISEQGYTRRIQETTDWIDKSVQFDIVFSELETVANIEIQLIDEKGKSRKMSIRKMVEADVFSQSFYAGYKRKSVILPAGNKAVITYSISCQYHYYLSSLTIKSPEVLNYSYFLSYPSDFFLHLDRSGVEDNLLSVVESTNTDGNKETYTISRMDTAFWKQKKKRNTSFYVTQPQRNRMRIQVGRKNTGKNGFPHFMEWYSALIQKSAIVDSSFIAQVKEVTHAGVGAREKTKLWFEHIQQKIRYVDVENGLGAFCPRTPIATLSKGIGDCKDMSQVLKSGLDVLNIPSYLAISSTLSHPYDLDFPALSSANHMICVVKLDDEYIPLDATEAYCSFGHPSRQIQGKNILIIKDDGELYRIPYLQPEENKEMEWAVLKESENGFEGQWKASLKGMGQLQLKKVFVELSGEEAKRKAEKILLRRGKGRALTNIEPVLGRDSLLVEGEMTVGKQMMNSMGKKQYLSCSFLPIPHSYPMHIDTSSVLTTYRSVWRKGDISLQFNGPVSLLKEISASISEGPFSYELNVIQSKEDELLIQYHYVMNGVQFSSQDLIAYNNVNQFIKSKLNLFISYEIH